MRFHHVVASATAGDYVTSVALRLSAIFEDAGHSAVYSADATHSEAHDDVLPLSELNSMHERDVIVLHAPLGDPVVADFVRTRPERLIVVDHGTPTFEPYLPFAPDLAGYLAAAPVQLALMRDRASAVIRATTIVDVDRVHSAELHGPTENHFINGIEGPVILFAGGVLPHERVECLIAAYHVLVTNLIPEAHLAIVGPGPVRRYVSALEHQINELNLNRAWIASGLSVGQMASYFGHASLFASMSGFDRGEEGLTAMTFGVPVVSQRGDVYGDAALDLGGAGIDGGAAGVLLMAEAMAELIDSPTSHERFVGAAKPWSGRYDVELVLAELVNAIAAAAGSADEKPAVAAE